MPNKHKLGAYIAPTHDQTQWRQYLESIDPGFIRVLMSGDSPTQQISDIHSICRDASISLRWWDLDDGGESEKRKRITDPVTCAPRDAREMVRRFSVMEKEAQEKGLPFPSRSQVYFNGVNEPPTWEHDMRSNIVRSNAMGALIAADNGFGWLFLEGAVGHPEEWPPVWDWAEPMFRMIEEGYGFLALHEYWQPEGPYYEWTDGDGKPRKDWGALAGRYRHLPHPVPTIITETGVDGRIYGRHATPDTGYKKFMQPEAFAAQLGIYLTELAKDDYILSALPFITDFADKEWASFDTLYARDAILSVLRAMDGRPPVVVEPPPAPNPPYLDKDFIMVRKQDLSDAKLSIEKALSILEEYKLYE